jgi:uncharacterized protein
MLFENVINSKAELREMVGSPSELAVKKVIHYLDDHCRDFISKSPFLVIATSDLNGKCDVSPRGDKVGFTLVLNERYIVIPERTGNKRVDSLNNIIDNPGIGLLYLIPGLKETLRVNGKAMIIQDEHILKQMAVNGKVPLVGVAVEVEECFLQCGKALLRSELWDQASWLNSAELPSGARILSDHAKIPNLDEVAVKQRLEEGYRTRMY